MTKNRGNKKKDVAILVARDLQIQNWNQSLNVEPAPVFGSLFGEREWTVRRSEPLTIQVSGTIGDANIQISMVGGVAEGDLREILGDPEGAISTPLKLTISRER